MVSTLPLVLPCRNPARLRNDPFFDMAFNSARPSGNKSSSIFSPWLDAEMLQHLFAKGDLPPGGDRQGGHASGLGMLKYMAMLYCIIHNKPGRCWLVM